MAKIIKLKDPVTNETQYPMTKLNCVYDNDGKNMGDVMVTYDLSKEYEPEINELLEKIYPIGSIYISTNGISPAEFLGGTWLPIEDKFLLGKGSSYLLGDEGGEARHLLTTAELPSHRHHQTFQDSAMISAWTNYSDGTQGAGWKVQGKEYGTDYRQFTTNTGNNVAHNNMPPYLVVAMYERIG